MAAATLTFPSQTLLKNVVDPVDGTDAATKEYVDGRTGAGSVAAAGSNTQIQFNSAGSIGASANLTFDYSGNILTINGNIVSSNANLGNTAYANFYTGDGGLLSNIIAAGGSSNTVSSSAQPNISSLGNLVNLQIGNLTSGLDGANGIVYFNGNGDANLSGNISTSGNITVGSGTGGSISGANSVTANFFIGSGNNLSNIQSGNITGIVANANYAEYAGNVVNASQPNITSVGTLTSLDVTGDVSGNNFTINGDLTVYGITTLIQSEIVQQSEIVTGNITAGNADLGNLAIANFFSGDGSLLTGIVASSGDSNFANYAGNVTESSQPNITSVGALTSLVVSGDANIQGNLIVGGTLTYIDSTKVSIVDPILDLGGGPDGAALSSTSTLDRGVLLHNYTSEATDAFMGWQTSSSQFIFASDASDISGVITVNDYANVKALNFLGNVVGSTANIGNLLAANANFTQSVKVTSPTDSTDYETGAVVLTFGGLGVYGNINARLDVSGTTLTGPLTTGSQPNITSLGTLTNVDVSGIGNISEANVGNLTVNNISNLGPAGNVIITGGTSGQYLQTDGAGNLSWESAASTNRIINGTSNVTVNNDGNVTIGSKGSSNVILVDGTGINVNGTLNVSQLTSLSTLTVTSTNATTLYSTGALTVAGGLGVAGNIVTNSNLTTSGNIFTSNIIISGDSTVQGDASFEKMVTLTAPTDSVSPSTGVLILTQGGLGVHGNINSGMGITGSTLTGSLTTASQPNITTVGTLSGLVVSGDITSSGASPAPSLSGFDSLSAVSLTGSLTTGSQPNITSVGTLTDLDVTGNINTGNLSVSGKTSLGTAGNITITGGTSGQYLQTDGTGNVSWKSVSTSNLINGNSNIVINPNGNINLSSTGSANVIQISDTQVVVGPTTASTSWDSGALLVNGGVGIAGNLYINGLLNVSGDFQVGNLNTSGPVEHTGAVTFTQVTYFSNTEASTSTTTGAVQITGGLGIQGNIFGGNIISGANIIRDGKNVPTFISSATMPTNPLLGDEWYDQGTDRIYQYIYDGSNYNWIDVSGGYIAANVEAQAGTLVVRNSNGNVYANNFVGNSLSVTNLAITGTTAISSMVSKGAGVAVSNTSDTLIDTFAKTLYRSAKYIVSARNDDGFEAMEVLLIHDDDISFIQTYGDISTGEVADIVILSSEIVAGNVCLYATGSNSNTFVNFVATYVTD